MRRPSASDRPTRRHGRETGSFLLEFALVSVVLVLLSFGVFAVGINCDRYLSVTHLAQSAAGMLRNGADFSEAGVQTVLLKAAAGLAITPTGGRGVIYVSRIERASSGTNNGAAVITHRYTIGNTAIGPSQIGAPTSVNSHGHVPNYENDLSARAVLPVGVTLEAGQTLHAAETVQSGTETAFTGFFVVGTMRARAIY